MHIGRWKFFSPSPHNPRLDLFHGIAQGSVAEVALGFHSPSTFAGTVAGFD